VRPYPLLSYQADLRTSAGCASFFKQTAGESLAKSMFFSCRISKKWWQKDSRLNAQEDFTMMRVIFRRSHTTGYVLSLIPMVSVTNSRDSCRASMSSPTLLITPEFFSPPQALSPTL